MNSMAKKPDDQSVNTAIISIVDDTFEQLYHAVRSVEPVIVEKNIIEYDGRMRLFPMEKFNAPAYVAVINYHLSQKKLEAVDSVGTFVLYVKEDVVDKLFKAFGYSAAEAEDEVKCMDVVGQLGDILAGNLKNKLLTMDCAELVISPPYKYKNAVPAGVPFDYSLFKKQEISFSFWKEKCVVIEACLGNIAAKGR
jgi:hypothetical protein